MNIHLSTFLIRLSSLGTNPRSPQTALIVPGPPEQVAAGQLQVPLVLGEDAEAVVPGAEAQRVQLLQLGAASGKDGRLNARTPKPPPGETSPDLELLLSSYWVPLVTLEGDVSLFNGDSMHRLHDLERIHLESRLS